MACNLSSLPALHAAGTAEMHSKHTQMDILARETTMSAVAAASLRMEDSDKNRDGGRKQTVLRASPNALGHAVGLMSIASS